MNAYSGSEVDSSKITVQATFIEHPLCAMMCPGTEDSEVNKASMMMLMECTRLSGHKKCHDKMKTLGWMRCLVREWWWGWMNSGRTSPRRWHLCSHLKGKKHAASQRLGQSLPGERNYAGVKSSGFDILVSLKVQKDGHSGCLMVDKGEGCVVRPEHQVWPCRPGRNLESIRKWHERILEEF